eukprot:scaffold121949_cov17-Tisochrysis_lutea.AAC.1
MHDSTLATHRKKKTCPLGPRPIPLFLMLMEGGDAQLHGHSFKQNGFSSPFFPIFTSSQCASVSLFEAGSTVTAAAVSFSNPPHQGAAPGQWLLKIHAPLRADLVEGTRCQPVHHRPAGGPAGADPADHEGAVSRMRSSPRGPAGCMPAGVGQALLTALHLGLCRPGGVRAREKRHSIWPCWMYACGSAYGRDCMQQHYDSDSVQCSTLSGSRAWSRFPPASLTKEGTFIVYLEHWNCWALLKC